MIAIKNMEMPKSCEVCDFRKSDPYSGEVYCSKAIGSNTIIYEKERLENCPLVADVVEREKIDKAIAEIHSYKHGNGNMFDCGMWKAIEILKRNIGE